MKSKSVFRPQAVRAYIQNQEKVVLPQLVVPRSFVLLWITLLILLTVVVIVFSTQIPVDCDGTAVVSSNDQQQLILFLPADKLGQVKSGQSFSLISLAKEPQLENQKGFIQSVEAELVSPAWASQKYKLDNLTGQAIQQPSVVAVAQFKPSVSSTFGNLRYASSSYRLKLTLSSRPIISMFPLVGNFFRN